jgi:hypothetical protein
MQIGVWYTAACVSLCLLLPLVLACGMLLLATWLWAAVSCSSIAMTPCVSRFGLSMWIALQLYFYSGGNLLQGERSTADLHLRERDTLALLDLGALTVSRSAK